MEGRGVAYILYRRMSDDFIQFFSLARMVIRRHGVIWRILSLRGMNPYLDRESDRNARAFGDTTALYGIPEWPISGQIFRRKVSRRSAGCRHVFT
jgi:hypothetical protein